MHTNFLCRAKIEPVDKKRMIARDLHCKDCDKIRKGMNRALMSGKFPRKAVTTSKLA